MKNASSSPASRATVGKLLILLLICLLAANAEARRKKSILYITGAPNIGSLYGIHLRMSAIIREHHELGIGYEAYLRESNNYPVDYQCPSCIHGRSKEGLSGLVMTYGYVIPSGALPKSLRYVLRGGLLLGTQSIPNNFEPLPSPGQRDPNYTYTVHDNFVAALILRPAVELAPGRYAGITLGPYAIFSKDFTGVGGTIGVMLGRVARLGTKDELAEKRARRQEAHEGGEQ